MYVREENTKKLKGGLGGTLRHIRPHIEFHAWMLRMVMKCMSYCSLGFLCLPNGPTIAPRQWIPVRKRRSESKFPCRPKLKSSLPSSFATRTARQMVTRSALGKAPCSNTISAPEPQSNMKSIVQRKPSAPMVSSLCVWWMVASER